MPGNGSFGIMMIRAPVQNIDLGFGTNSKNISTRTLLSQCGFCLTSWSAVSAYLWAFLGFYDFVLARQKLSFYKKLVSKLVSNSKEIPFLTTVYQYHKL